MSLAMDWSHPHRCIAKTRVESTREAKEGAVKTVIEANSHGRIRRAGFNLCPAKKIAQSRTRWKVTVNGLCSARKSDD